jgi:hypothetical protein
VHLLLSLIVAFEAVRTMLSTATQQQFDIYVVSPQGDTPSFANFHMLLTIVVRLLSNLSYQTTIVSSTVKSTDNGVSS